MAKTVPAKQKRVYFTDNKVTLELPNLITHQLDSWKEFVETGLGEILPRSTL